MSIYHNAKCWDASGMDIYAIRKQNLLAIMAGKTQRSCADRWETSPSTLSQIVSKNPVRNLGDDLARKIEQAEGLPAGWFDHVHGERQPEPARAEQAEPDQGAAEVAHHADMLAMAATPRSREILRRIAMAADEGRLTEGDLDLLDQIAARFESRQPDVSTTPATPHQRLREKLKRND